MSLKDVVIDLLAVASLIIVLILLHGGTAPSNKPTPKKQRGAAPSKKPAPKKQNRIKILLDKEAEIEQNVSQRRIEEVRPDLMNKIEQYPFIQELLSDAKDTLGWKRAAIEPYEGWSFIGNYMHPNQSYAYVYGYALHQYTVRKYVDRKVQPDNTHTFISKKRTYHQGVAIVAAKRRTAGDIKLYIAEYGSPSDGVNSHGTLRRYRLIQTIDNSAMAHEDAMLKALKEYVKHTKIYY